jgi:hypothetical protein
MAIKVFLFSRMPTYDNSYEARTRRLKGAAIAQYKAQNPTKPIQGPSGRDASTLTTAKGGQGAYIIVQAKGQAVEYTGCCG